MVIIGSDLRFYGFNVFYDNSTRTSYISYDGSGTWNPIVSTAEVSQSIGEKVMDVYESDISVCVNGNYVNCYNVNGNMAFRFSELKIYGDYYYDNSSRTSNLWYSTAPVSSNIQQSYEYNYSGSDNHVHEVIDYEYDDYSYDDTPSTYSAGETWVVDNQWEFTINSVDSHSLCNSYSNKRNEYSDEQVVLIDYSYKNLGYTGSFQDLYFSSISFDVYDEDGESAKTYACTHGQSPKVCAIGTKCSNATEAYVLKNESDYITIIIEYYTSNGNGRRKAAYVVLVE